MTKSPQQLNTDPAGASLEGGMVAQGLSTSASSSGAAGNTQNQYSQNLIQSQYKKDDSASKASTKADNHLKKTESEDQSESERKNFIERVNQKLKENFCNETEVLGIEIQPDKIRLCEAIKNSQGLWQINKLASHNVLNNYSYESLSKNKSLYSKALKDLIAKQKINKKSAAVSIPASSAIIKTISLPLMTKQNLEKATKIKSFWQNLVQISDNLADYSIFYRIIKEIPEKKEMELLFVATKKDDLKLFREIIEGAGLTPVVVDVGCFSVNNLSKLRAAKDSDLETEVFLKIGRDENYLQILEEGKPSIYDIFVPENEKFYLNEYLGHQTFQQRFTSQLNHIISKYEEKTKQKISDIKIFSSEENIEEFIKNLNAQFEDLKVSKADFFDEIEVSQKISDMEEFKINKTAWGVCVGLATRKVDIFSDDDDKDISETVNLLPEAKEVKSDLKSKFYSKILVWSVAFISMISVLLFGIYSYGRYNSRIVEIQEFNKLNSEYKSNEESLSKIQSESAILNKLISARDEIPANQLMIIKAFEEISKNIPEGVWIQQFKFDESGMIIEGRGFEEKKVIGFSKLLDSSKHLQGISIASLRTAKAENGVTIKEFIIKGNIVK